VRRRGEPDDSSRTHDLHQAVLGHLDPNDVANAPAELAFAVAALTNAQEVQSLTSKGHVEAAILGHVTALHLPKDPNIPSFTPVGVDSHQSEETHIDLRDLAVAWRPGNCSSNSRTPSDMG
jgi:hypothetical protein